MHTWIKCMSVSEVCVIWSDSLEIKGFNPFLWSWFHYITKEKTP